MSEQNVVDSSAWLEYFADGPNADHFAPAIKAIDALIVPAVTIYEVDKRVLQQRDESDALRSVALMQQGDVVTPNSALSLEATAVSITHKLPIWQTA